MIAKVRYISESGNNSEIPLGNTSVAIYEVENALANNCFWTTSFSNGKAPF